MSSEVGVVSAVRSPFGKFGGALRDFTLPELGGRVVAEAIRRAGIDPADVEEVATGVNLPGADRSIAPAVPRWRRSRWHRARSAWATRGSPWPAAPRT